MPSPLSRRFLALSGLLVTLTCHAQGIRFIGVDTSAEQEANFRITYQEPGTTHEFGVVDGMIAHLTHRSGSAVFLLDSTPKDREPDAFRDLAVEFDFSLGCKFASIGVIFGGRNQTAYNLVVFNIGHNDQDSLRFLTGLSAYGPRPDTKSLTSVGLPAGSWRPQITYHATFTLSYTAADRAEATFTITDPSGQNLPLTVTARDLPVAQDHANLGFRSAFMVPSVAPNSFDNFVITELR